MAETKGDVIRREGRGKLTEYEHVALLGSRILELQREVSKLRDTVAERDAEIDTLRAMIADDDK